MNRISIESSQIASIGYDSLTETLEIEFVGFHYRPNTVYRFFGFKSTDWNAFAQADSIGLHFEKVVKGKFQSAKVSDSRKAQPVNARAAELMASVSV